MRRAVTFVVIGESFKLVSGPEVPIAAQLANLKEARCKSDLGEIDRVEVWTSNGSVKTAKFKKRPVAVVPPAASEGEEKGTEDTGKPEEPTAPPAAEAETVETSDSKPAKSKK